MPQDDMIHKQRHVKMEPVHVAEYTQPVQLFEEPLQQHQENQPAAEVMEAVVHQVAPAPEMAMPAQQKELDFKERIAQKKAIRAEKRREKVVRKEQIRQEKQHAKQEKKEEKKEQKQMEKLAKQKVAQQKQYDATRDGVVAQKNVESTNLANQYTIYMKNSNLDERTEQLKKLGIAGEVEHKQLPLVTKVGAVKNRIINSVGNVAAKIKALDTLSDLVRQLDPYNAEFQKRDVLVQKIIPMMREADLAKGVSQEEADLRSEICTKQAEKVLADYIANSGEIYEEFFQNILGNLRKEFDIPNADGAAMEANSAEYFKFLKVAQIEHAKESSSLKATIDELAEKIKAGAGDVAAMQKELEAATLRRGTVNSDSPDIYYLKKNNGAVLN